MCKRTFFEERFTVSDIEICRKGKSYTFDTLCRLKEIYKNSSFFLVIGSDMLLSFHKWYRYDDILKMATLCAVSRQDAESAQDLMEYAKNILGLDALKDEIIISETKPFELSSTEIRNRLKNGGDVSGLIEENTLLYIKEKGLYNEIY